MGGMKGTGSLGLRGRRAFLLLIVTMCATIFFWASERTPRLPLSIAPKQRLDLSPRDVMLADNDDDGDDDGGSRELANRLEELVAGGVGESARPEGATVVASGYEELQSAPPPVKRRECNYAKGEWVADSRRPLYSGYGCKRWLSEMWACRLTRRTDFSFEAFRWQPENCPMPEFRGSSFLERMRGKTLAFVGDSLGRQQFQSLMCMITAGKEGMQVEDVGEEYGFVTTEGSLRPSGWAYRFPSTNATVLYHWSATLCELEPLNISDPRTTVAMHLDRPASFLKQYLHKLDVLVLNTGHHWNRGKLNGNRWEMYVGGTPVRDRYLRMIGNAKNFTVHSVVKWLDRQLPSHPHMKAFFRSISPRHFFNGEWNTGGSCDNTSPLAHGNRVLQEGSDDLVAASAMRGTNVKFLDITALSQLRDEGHISKYGMKASSVVHDCLHWCLPGIPDTWNEILAAQL